MRYRRLLDQLRRQDWMAIAIDLVIVVVGVFIGIQVANWNDGRKEQAGQAVLVQRLYEEFLSIEPLLAQAVAELEASARSTGAVITALRRQAPPEDADAFRADLASANWVRFVPGYAATYTELVSAGGLSKLANHDLRAALTRYGDIHARSERMFAAAYSTILDPQSNYYSAVEWSVEPEAWTGPDAVERFDWDALRASRAEMQAWITYQVELQRLAGDELAEVRRVLSILQGGDR